jgi:hypothetical protein
METEVTLNKLLCQLKSVVSSTRFSRKKVLSALNALISWLNIPENNTDNNCQYVDYFVSYEIMSEKRFKDLPEDIRGILFDMGATLHDTHTSPQIAENFESTPSQLNERMQKLIIRRGNSR